MPPFTFSEIDAVDDALDASRFIFRFPTIPGGGDAEKLTILGTTAQFPEAATAQVNVKFPGGISRRFRGGSNTDGTLTVVFIEDSKGNASKIMNKWRKFVRDSDTSTSKSIDEYAVDCEAVWFDTKGDDALALDLFEIWPMNVGFPSVSEQSGQSEFTVTFSVKKIKIRD